MGGEAFYGDPTPPHEQQQMLLCVMAASLRLLSSFKMKLLEPLVQIVAADLAG